MVLSELEGSWKINSVRKDGNALEGWEGIELIFEQSEARGVRYEMPLSSYDSIWPKQGSWMVDNEGGPLEIVANICRHFLAKEEEHFR